MITEYVPPTFAEVGAAAEKLSNAGFSFTKVPHRDDIYRLHRNEIEHWYHMGYPQAVRLAACDYGDK